MLLANLSDRNFAAINIAYGDTEEPFAHKNAFGVMTKSTVSKIRKMGLGFIKP
ncbi:MAG: hypothetical protein JWM57_615 [Phycisphaerales bacterium]|nr:hypothetical protein [Phycisphaerales bacterium]